jgi:acyl-coenzyme A thioesterase PaaI-like protein
MSFVSPSSPGTRLHALWKRLAPLPGGRWLFSRVFGWMVPYSGSIRPLVVALEPGHARVVLHDRRRVRNHLRSVHAVALANLGEAASGLALVGGLPPTARGILTRLEIEFVKKARGRLEAECSCRVPRVSETLDQVVTARIRDAGGDEVAVVTAHWRLGPTKPRHGGRT